MHTILFAGLAVLAAPASAAVLAADPHGFEVANSVLVAVPPSEAYSAFANLGSWWGDDHTYSGKAVNMRLALQAGGCFCESLPGGGGVEHMRVAVVLPNERIVLTGSLGPVLYEAANGVMDVTFKPAEGGTSVTMNYRAAGFAKGGADKLAPLVDMVLADQLNRYRTYVAAKAR